MWRGADRSRALDVAAHTAHHIPAPRPPPATGTRGHALPRTDVSQAFRVVSPRLGGGHLPAPAPRGATERAATHAPAPSGILAPVANRTFAIGDIHGELEHLRALVAKLPLLDAEDTLVFLGDYVDRGACSEEVVRVVRAFARELGCKVVTLRGNHEDAWLRVIERGWPEFVFPPGNGCLATMRSFRGGKPPGEDEMPTKEEHEMLFKGTFFPDDVVAWMKELPWFYEDEHAIYVHAGLVRKDGVFLHPSETEPKTALLWTRTDELFTEYRGKRVVIGHTKTELLPPELSSHTPDDPTDLWAGECVVAVDTGCGSGGFLSAVELPALNVYESR
jgi:serine/threonine protein phosphatase 1